MADTNLFWTLRGTYAERKAKLAAWPKDRLEASILDREYNDFLRSRADFNDEQEKVAGRGKRLPYIGWFWRHLEFSDGALPLGNCGEFVGFIADNKWDYPERMTAPEEFAQIMAIIDAAMKANEQGGEINAIEAATNAELEKLWHYLQTLEV